MNRRYDIDWLRVIAIGLLLIYHIAITFQPWGLLIGFITNDESWQSLWVPMSMLNVWRIPFLFFVSGMGVFFAMQHRSWKYLLRERSLRILLPYVFGAICIFPISVLLLQHYNNWNIAYTLNPGHLWFLGHIFSYVVVMAPLFYYLKNHQEGRFVSGLRIMLATPLGLIPFVALFIAEVLIIKPVPYELYATTWHGYVLGFLAFFSGFCFVLAGDPFWKMILQWRWMFLALAMSLFLIRTYYFGMTTPGYLIVIESDSWIFAVLGFGHKYLNRKSDWLPYLSEAAYPVYIVHMIFMSLSSMVIFPLELPVWIKFIAMIFLTLGGCLGAFEIIRRINFIRPLFGMKMKTKDKIKMHNHEPVATGNQ